MYTVYIVDSPIMAMRFGPYGREDNSLVIIHGVSGSMTIKILKRLFDFESINHRIGATAEQEIPIQVLYSIVKSTLLLYYTIYYSCFNSIVE
jgi:hypothetical protein